jgi:general secretion pathway protein K
MNKNEQTIIRKNKKEKGAALLMALFFFTIVSFVVSQLSSETLTESILAGRQMKVLRARYAAKAGLEMALLRIKAYQTAQAAIDSLPEDQKASVEQQLSLIWQFPLPWPLPITDDAGLILKDGNAKVLKKSLISNLNFFHEIQDAGTKLDLNSIGSPIKTISEKTIESLLRSFEQLLETDKELADEHSLDSIKIVLNNIADWIDEDDESRNGGSEQSFYTFEGQEGYPRNGSFLSFSELMLVDKMDDLIFKRLKNLVTSHGTFGINVNTAEKDVLMSIDPQFTEDVTKKFLARRAEIQAAGANLNESSFDSLLDELGFSNIQDIHSKGVPIVYTPLTTFEVTSSSQVGKTEVNIKAFVVNANELKELFIEQLEESSKKDSDPENPPPPNPSPGGGQPADPNAKKKEPPKGKPYIVHMEVS